VIILRANGSHLCEKVRVLHSTCLSTEPEMGRGERNSLNHIMHNFWMKWDCGNFKLTVVKVWDNYEDSFLHGVKIRMRYSQLSFVFNHMKQKSMNNMINNKFTITFFGDEHVRNI
jgi:hypothetical protein